MKQDDTVLLCTSMQDGKSDSLYKHEDSCRAGSTSCGRPVQECCRRLS